AAGTAVAGGPGWAGLEWELGGEAAQVSAFGAERGLARQRRPAWQPGAERGSSCGGAAFAGGAGAADSGVGALGGGLDPGERGIAAAAVLGAAALSGTRLLGDANSARMTSSAAGRPNCGQMRQPRSRNPAGRSSCRRPRPPQRQPSPARPPARADPNRRRPCGRAEATQNCIICARPPGGQHVCQPLLFGREDVGSASGPAFLLPALLPWFWPGAGVASGALGPGLTSESADAARAVLLTTCRPGPSLLGTHRRCRSDLPGLGKRPGCHRSEGQRVRAIPQPQKGMT